MVLTFLDLLQMLRNARKSLIHIEEQITVDTVDAFQDYCKKQGIIVMWKILDEYVSTFKIVRNIPEDELAKQLRDSLSV